MKTKSKFLLTVLGTCSLAGFAFGQASLLLPGGAVALGVNREGHLNAPDPYGYAINAGALGVTAVGLGDATSPGCLCEGWGVSANGTDSGYANVSSDGGAQNLTVDSFVTDDVGSGAGTFATSKVHVTSMPGLEVSQHYAASTGAPTLLFQDTVTITNSSLSTMSNVKYVRVMDWDIPPTEFSELVTIKGTATTAALEKSHDNGFNTANPLADYGGSGTDIDFTDLGPADHGAYFRFNFGSLAAGESITFSIFYGAAANETAALAAMGAVSAELYSFGQNNHTSHNEETTFMFAFKGVGGVVIEPVPDTGSSLLLIGMGLAALAAARRRITA